MASPRRNPVGRAGNYAQEIDTTGIDPEMKETLGLGIKMNKIESDYVKGTGRATAIDAVRRARKANIKK
jgi:uncharacterized protein YqfA (UPF0365 family)